MKTFVITPYFEANPQWLQQAHESVRSQTVPAHHILVCDGSAHVPVSDFKGSHIILGRNYKDYGNTPRLIGCFHAINQGADAIAFLDADNWFHPNHVADLLAFAVGNGLDFCSSARMLHRLDGTPMIKCPHVNGKTHVDTNCLLVLKSAFPHLLSWVLSPQDKAAVADQFVWKFLLKQSAKFGFLDEASVAYRTRHTPHYRLAGEAPPEGSVTRVDLHGECYC